MSISTSSSSTKSAGGELPTRELLFGEIDSTGTQCEPCSLVSVKRCHANDFEALRSNNSICNLILSSSSTFTKFWLVDRVRDALLAQIEQAELVKLRLVCHDFSNRIAPIVFRDLHVTFKTSSFTRPARSAALNRIGHHVRTFTFKAPHKSNTFLPPLVDPATGQETSFVYTPQVHTPETLLEKVKHPKYGSWIVADLLVKQYPPLFHASTNVPAFTRVLEALPNLTHLKVSCPSQGALSSGRRSTVDYALISLRIAIERAPLPRLHSISFLPIHAAGLFYMQPINSFGASPKSLRKWAQIRSMSIRMQSFESDKATRADHLKTLHAYLKGFACTLKQFTFKWEGIKGPSPISLDSEPCECLSDINGASKSKLGLRALRFTTLHHMELDNAEMDAAQISAFICQHKRTLTEFKFEHIRLRTGDWDQALSPLAEDIKAQARRKSKRTESMEVPLVLSPQNSARTMREELVHDLGEQPVERQVRSLGKWMRRAGGVSAGDRAREQFIFSSEQVRKVFRKSFGLK